MSICAGCWWYHGAGGISRGMLRVRHGASKLPARFLPMMLPMTVSGKPTAPIRRAARNRASQMGRHYDEAVSAVQPTLVDQQPIPAAKMTASAMTVPKGSACVEWYDHAIEFSTLHTRKSGTVASARRHG